MQGELSVAVAVLSAMITPAVLISACGSLLIATSNRLGRVVDRTCEVSQLQKWRKPVLGWPKRLD